MTEANRPNHLCAAHRLTAVKWLFTPALLLALLHATGHAGPALLLGRILRMTDGDQHLALWQDSDATAPSDWRARRRVHQRKIGRAIMLGKLALHAGAIP